jgi:hypothetical protein
VEEVADSGEVGGPGLRAAAVEDGMERVGEDRRDRISDTRLSRASNPWLAGPRLCSS